MLFYLFFTIMIFWHVEACLLIRAGPLECEDIKSLLVYHNYMRNKVALGRTKLPAAKNMWQLKWDHGLAELATSHAESCNLKPNANRPKRIGENTYWKESVTPSLVNVKEMFGHWYLDIENYQYPNKYNGTEGRIYKIIWGKTMFIGCGLSLFNDSDSSSHFSIFTYLVCNYRPFPYQTESYEGKVPYLKDDGSDKCDNGLISVIYTGLCSHDEAHRISAYSPCVSDIRGRKDGANTAKPTYFVWPTLAIHLYHRIFN